MKLTKKTKQLLIGIALLITPLSLFAFNHEDKKIEWFIITIGFFGGLALFLYGMEKMSAGMKKSAGNRMRKILAKLSNNRFIGLFVGAFVTMIIQSSSATTVMLVSFVRSNLMTVGQTLAVILGANIGTTFTAQLIAFKVTDYAILVVAIGFAFSFIFKRESLKNFGDTILGFGLLFFGMKLMSDAMVPLREYDFFINILRNLENPVFGIIVGLVFTALIQSSSAFTGIIIVLAQDQSFTLQAAIPMIIGANIGTCVTAGLSSIGTSRAAKRVALAHTFFKFGGALLFIFWIPYFADLIQWSGKYFGAGPSRQIANAHTFFNVVVTLFFIPFTKPIAKLLVKIIPDSKVDDMYEPKIKYLDNTVLKNPMIAIDLARSEIASTVKLLRNMLQIIIVPFTTEGEQKDKQYKNVTLQEGLKIREEKIDFLESKITKYLNKITKNELSESQMKEIFSLMSVINYIETIGDTIHNDIIPLIAKKEELEYNFTEDGENELIDYHLRISKQISRLIEYFETRDVSNAEKIIIKWKKYTLLDAKYRTYHYMRMHDNKSSVKTHKLHMELMDYFLQIGFLVDNIAKIITKKDN